MGSLVTIAGLFAVYALVASKLDRWSISGPMVFLIAGALLGPAFLGAISGSATSEFTKTIAEFTLAVLLFADASSISLRKAEGDSALPIRLLLIGLPLTLVLGTLVAFAIFPAAGWASAALVAAILAPTDAALGLPVYNNKAVPARIRRSLNIESGLNDGIATPFVVLALALVIGRGDEGSFLVNALEEISIAIAMAVAVGVGGGVLTRLARKVGWTTPVSEDLMVLSLALLSYSASVAVGGNGFVAAFLGGIFFGRMTRRRLGEATEFTETVGLFGSYLVWVLFGVNFVGPALKSPALAPIFYAVISLTLVRMAPVALALLGTRLRGATIAFCGWFGPRGLASAVFTLLSLDALHEAGMASEHIVETATWTITLSVVLHGLSSGPLAARYGRAVNADPSRYARELQESITQSRRKMSIGGVDR